ncbi:MAG: hypothetical protein AB7K24_02300 [Gemmataceae bacterium]
MDEVPWDRIVHFYGRASNIPKAVRQLNSKKHAKAAGDLLAAQLEHQDGVIQATPFAVRFMVRALACERVVDKAHVWWILRRIQCAASFTTSSHSQNVPKAIADWRRLLQVRRLWPEFKNKREDEILWEEWDPPEEEWLGWAVLTLREIAKTDSLV